jgi:hypothetical protein
MSKPSELEKQVYLWRDKCERAKRRLADWQDERDRIKSELEEQFESDGATYKRSVKLLECEEAIDYFSCKLGDLKPKLDELEGELERGRLRKAYVETKDKRKQAIERLQEIDEEVIEFVKDRYNEAFQVIEDVNARINRLNRRGGQRLSTIDKFNGLDPTMWVEGLVRAGVLEGKFS